MCYTFSIKKKTGVTAMRRLWIQRHKAAAAGLMAMKVYIEDPENGDTTINGVLCRKLGLLKNGRKAHFTIGEESRKVFVVADKVSRNLYNEFIQLPEGRDDIFLSGRNYLQPFSGNPFRFDGVEEESVLENRKRVVGVGSVVLVIAILLGIAGGIAAGVLISRSLMEAKATPPTAKVFSVEGMEITLTDRFALMQAEGATAGFSGDDAVVYVLREDFDAFEGFAELSLAGYGTMVLENNGLADAVTLQEEGDMAVFEYLFTQEDSAASYYYYCVARKGTDAFWLVQFAVPAQEQEIYQSVFPHWAQTITLEN
jgi:hypothetical protein